MGAHVRVNLEEAITIAQRIEIYQGSNSKTQGQAAKKLSKEEKRFCQSTVGTTLWERRPRLMQFSRCNEKETRAEGKGQTHRREDVGQSNAIAMEEFNL